MLAATATAETTSAAEPQVLELTAKRFEFSPNEAHLKKDEPVTLRIASADVTHGLCMKSLGIDAEIERRRGTVMRR